MMKFDVKIKINRIVPRSLVDGPGERTVVFLQGCTLACSGCQNRALWDKQAGHTENAFDLAATVALLAGEGGSVTISGGEPFQQPAALATLVLQLKKVYGVSHIIVYSGYTIEELVNPTNPAFDWLYSIFSAIDVLVDGRFIKQLDDDLIQYRGSRNQRAINIPATIANHGELVLLDWDTPEIVITPDGGMVMTAGMAKQFTDAGEINNTAMCGQTHGR